MNTIGSVYYGWAFLILCGGGSYYFAKRSINADRASQQTVYNEKRFRHNRELATGTQPPNNPVHEKDRAILPSNKTGSSGKTVEHKHKDSSDLGHSTAGVLGEKSKFESSEPYRSRKGDRFSSIGKE